jgi:hypothetical protein
MYAVIGYFAPDLFFPTLIAGAAFEYVEHRWFGCADVLDIGWNTLGFFLGRSARMIV